MANYYIVVKLFSSPKRVSVTVSIATLKNISEKLKDQFKNELTDIKITSCSAVRTVIKFPMISYFDLEDIAILVKSYSARCAKIVNMAIPSVAIEAVEWEIWEEE